MSTYVKSTKQLPYGVGKSQMGTKHQRKSRVTASIISKRSGGATTFGGTEKQWLQSKVPVQVFDEDGYDVTPLPLQLHDTIPIKKHQSTIIEPSDSTPTDRSIVSVFNKTAAVSTLYGGGPFTRSVLSQSDMTDSYVEEIHESATDLTTAWPELHHIQQGVADDLTDADLEADITINLCETPTFWLLDLPGVVYMDDEEKMAKIKEENDRYMKLKTNRVGNDLYMERGMMTFNEPPKFKNSQTNKIGLNDVSVTATAWDMYDSYLLRDNAPTEVMPGDEDEAIVNASPSAATRSEKVISQKTMIDSKRGNDSSRRGDRSTFGTDSAFDSKLSFSTLLTDATAPVIDETYIFSLPEFQRDLFTMERAVNLNTYQNKQALYRGFPLVVTSPDGDAHSLMDSGLGMPDLGPHVDRLWVYPCPLTKGHNVSSMAWNKVNPDLLAVGYGQFEFNNQRPGLVCCWSLKNPDYPERILNCPQGVTSLDFSLTMPNLLAVGLHNGGIVIYNVHTTKDETVIDSLDCPNKHIAPIWQIQWITKDRGQENEEVLVSVSTDGRVTQWSIRKGFEHYDLMKLKRLPTRMQGRVRERKGEAYISRYAGGFTFDFHPMDPNIYLVGTEDSFIHKCSCSYIEQYLETYSGHTEPVYKVKWSRFEPDLFISCSADWTIRLWHQHKSQAVLIFHSSTKAVYDLCWSLTTPTVFSCVSQEYIEIWDLNVSILDPIIKNTGISKAKKTAVLFAQNSQSVLVGDNDGQVTVFQLQFLPAFDPEKQSLMKIVESTLANQLSTFDNATSENSTNRSEETWTH